MKLNIFLLLCVNALPPIKQSGLIATGISSELTTVYTIVSRMKGQVMRLWVKSNGSVFDPVVHSFISEQIKLKLKENGMLENTTVTWRVQPNGNTFNKIKKDDL